MVLYLGKSKITPSAYAINPTGTINITENGVIDVTKYANADVQVSSSTDNIYSLNTIKELEDEICYGTLSEGTLITKDILGDNSQITPLRDDWTYSPADIAEIYQNILTNDHIYVKEKFEEVLGENNE